MSSGDQVSPDVVLWVATRVVRMHIEPPPHTMTDEPFPLRCAQCPPTGDCPMLMWALTVVPRRTR